MKGTIISRILILSLCILLCVSMVACQSKAPESSASTSSQVTTEASGQETKPVTIKLFSNSTDRKSGGGKVEQTLMDQYMAENPNITVVSETLANDAYKEKFKTYAASNTLPDIYMVFGFPAFFEPIMQAGLAAELNMDDYKDYGFTEGSLNGFSLNDKLYGLPKGMDFYVLYYNKKLFSDNGVNVPSTFEDILTASKTFREKGIIPIAINGKEKWALADLYHDLVLNIIGDQDTLIKAVTTGSPKFSEEPAFLEAANDLKALIDVKAFQDSFTSADYGTALNLFAQQQAAMYFMATWEAGMCNNESYTQEFRDNLDIIPFPVKTGGKGKATDLHGWVNGGYAVSSASSVKDESIKFLNYMLKRDNWAKLTRTLGAGLPAQDFSEFVTDKDPMVQQKIVQILKTSTSITGISWFERNTPEFKNAGEDITQELAAGLITPEVFLKKIDEAMAP